MRLRGRMWQPGPLEVGREPTPPARASVRCTDVASLRIRLRPPRWPCVTREARPDSRPSGHEAAQSGKTDTSTLIGCVGFAPHGVPFCDAKHHSVVRVSRPRGKCWCFPAWYPGLPVGGLLMFSVPTVYGWVVTAFRHDGGPTRGQAPGMVRFALVTGLRTSNGSELKKTH